MIPIKDFFIANRTLGRQVYNVVTGKRSDRHFQATVAVVPFSTLTGVEIIATNRDSPAPITVNRFRLESREMVYYLRCALFDVL